MESRNQTRIDIEDVPHRRLVVQQVMLDKTFLASVLMNRRLINEQGRNLGMVEDLMIDRDSNRVEKIIVSSVDILGENFYAAVPYEPLGFTVYGLVYDLMPGELKNFTPTLHRFPRLKPGSLRLQLRSELTKYYNVVSSL